MKIVICQDTAKIVFIPWCQEHPKILYRFAIYANSLLFFVDFIYSLSALFNHYLHPTIILFWEFSPFYLLAYFQCVYFPLSNQFFIIFLTRPEVSGNVLSPSSVLILKGQENTSLVPTVQEAWGRPQSLSGLLGRENITCPCLECYFDYTEVQLTAYSLWELTYYGSFSK